MPGNGRGTGHYDASYTYMILLLFCCCTVRTLLPACGNIHWRCCVCSAISLLCLLLPFSLPCINHRCGSHQADECLTGRSVGHRGTQHWCALSGRPTNRTHNAFYSQWLAFLLACHTISYLVTVTAPRYKTPTQFNLIYSVQSLLHLLYFTKKEEKKKELFHNCTIMYV